MSWQALVDEQLVKQGGMVSAAIFGVDGNPWACDGPVTTVAEPREIIRLIKIIEGEEKDYNGIHVGHVPYLYLSHDPSERSIKMSRKGATSDDLKYVLTGFLSAQCFVIGVVNNSYKAGNCCSVTCKLRDYLKQSGY